MPPIPKFAKALAKLSKANPKVISGETLPKIKKRNTSEKTTEKQIKTKRFAKDDMELDKIRREKIKKKLEQILPKKAKDDSELLLVAKKLENANIDTFKISDAISYVSEFKKFLHIIKNNLQTNKTIFPLIISFENILNEVDISKCKDVPKKLILIMNQIQEKVKKGG